METYSEKMLQALAAENLADAQLNFASLTSGIPIN